MSLTNEPFNPTEISGLILASASPRRRELLTTAGYNFMVHPASDTAECGICSGETPPEFVGRMAFQKATDVAETFHREAKHANYILGCDTIAECCGHQLGKPKNRQHAQEMIDMLRGREHRVYSGVCLINIPSDKTIIRVDCTTLVMQPISDQQLQQYLDTDDWEGKAGAFGYQDGHDWLQITEGSESNVVGLPLELLAAMFGELQGS